MFRRAFIATSDALALAKEGVRVFSGPFSLYDFLSLKCGHRDHVDVVMQAICPSKQPPMRVDPMVEIGRRARRTATRVRTTLTSLKRLNVWVGLGTTSTDNVTLGGYPTDVMIVQNYGSIGPASLRRVTH